ncbi:MAG: hypothetical protein K8R58_06150 [Bacteroidales bacterium]|nr:hypothetical protein [Bacteroidales bacterium]
MKNEVHVRIKINKLLEEAGWRFFDNEESKASTTLSLTQVTYPDYSTGHSERSRRVTKSLSIRTTAVTLSVVEEWQQNKVRSIGKIRIVNNLIITLKQMTNSKILLYQTKDGKIRKKIRTTKI